MIALRVNSHIVAPIAVTRRAMRHAEQVLLPEGGAGGVSQKVKDEYLFIKNAFSCDLCELRLAMTACLAKSVLPGFGQSNSPSLSNWGERCPPLRSHIPSRPLLTKILTATRRFWALPWAVLLSAKGSALAIPVGVSMR